MAQMQKQCAQNIELHAKTCSIYGCYAQILIWSKAEMFIHIALRTWFSYTELRKTDGEQTFLINGISNHFSEICIQSIEIHCGVACPTTFVKSVVKFDLKFIVFLA